MGKKYAKTSRKERFQALSRAGREAKRRRISHVEGNQPSRNAAAERPSEEGTTTRPYDNQPSSQSSTSSANVDDLSTQSAQETSEEEPKPSTSKATDIFGTCRSKQRQFDSQDTIGIQSSDPFSDGAGTTDFSSDPDYYPSPNKRHLLYRPIALHVGKYLLKVLS